MDLFFSTTIFSNLTYPLLAFSKDASLQAFGLLVHPSIQDAIERVSGRRGPRITAEGDVKIH